MANLFDRLGKGQPQPEEAIKQHAKNTERVARGIQETNARAFLMDVLANGPVPAASSKNSVQRAGSTQASFGAPSSKYAPVLSK